jgi:hypothetical protein
MGAAQEPHKRARVSGCRLVSAAEHKLGAGPAGAAALAGPDAAVIDIVEPLQQVFGQEQQLSLERAASPRTRAGRSEKQPADGLLRLAPALTDYPSSFLAYPSKLLAQEFVGLLRVVALQEEQSSLALPAVEYQSMAGGFLGGQAAERYPVPKTAALFAGQLDWMPHPARSTQADLVVVSEQPRRLTDGSPVARMDLGVVGKLDDPRRQANLRTDFL